MQSGQGGVTERGSGEGSRGSGGSRRDSARGRRGAGEEQSLLRFLCEAAGCRGRMRRHGRQVRPRTCALVLFIFYRQRMLGRVAEVVQDEEEEEKAEASVASTGQGILGRGAPPSDVAQEGCVGRTWMTVRLFADTGRLLHCVMQRVRVISSVQVFWYLHSIGYASISYARNSSAFRDVEGAVYSQIVFCRPLVHCRGA